MDAAGKQSVSAGPDLSEAGFDDTMPLGVQAADLKRGWLNLDKATPDIPQNYNPSPWSPQDNGGFLGRPSGWER
jgi:hypothetical protein